MFGYLAEPLLAARGHTHVHLAVLRAVVGRWWVVEVLLQGLHPRQQLRYSTRRQDGKSEATTHSYQKELNARVLFHPLEAEYCRARFMPASLKVTACPFFTSIVADWKGNVLGLGAPPAREMRVGGDRCCSSASSRHKTTQFHVRVSGGAVKLSGTDRIDSAIIWCHMKKKTSILKGKICIRCLISQTNFKPLCFMRF